MGIKFLNTLLTVVLLLVAFTATAAQPLWKISDKDNTVYLLGSFHLLRKDQLSLTPEMKKALNSADVYVFELNMNEAQSLQTQLMVARKSMLTPPENLKRVISADLYNQLSAALEDDDISLATVSRLKPWAAAMTIMVLRLKQMGYDPENGIDMFFHRQANYRGREIIGLETMEYQIDRFDKLSMAIQSQFLEETLGELEMMEAEFEKLVGYWQNGDLDSLNRYALAPMRRYPDIYQRLLVERNIAWLDEIKKYVADDRDYLFIVGTAHYAGPDGLITLLKKEGFRPVQF